MWLILGFGGGLVSGWEFAFEIERSDWLPLLPHLPLDPVGVPALWDMTNWAVVQSAIAAITKAFSPENIKSRCARLFSLLGISPSDVVAKMEEATYYNASAMFTPFLRVTSNHPLEGRKS